MTMPRRSSMSHTMLLALLLLMAPLPSLAAMTAWWTDKGPNVAMQDPKTGSIVYSACNSNNTPIFPVDKPHTLDVSFKARNGTALAAAGWWNSKTTVGSFYYQDTRGRIMNIYAECNWTTGDFIIKGEYPISETASVPSVHEETGLSIELLGSADGYRLFYHDEDRNIEMMAYTQTTYWTYKGVVSTDKASGMTLVSAHTGKENITLLYPRDENNMGLSRFNSDKKWWLSSIPKPFPSFITNDNTTAEVKVYPNATANYTLSGWVANPKGLGLTIDKQYTRSIFYIGSDRRLHRLASVNFIWDNYPNQTEKLWPKADVPNGELAATFSFEKGQCWVYYFCNGSIIQAMTDSNGIWKEAITLPVVNLTASTDEGEPTPTPTNTPTPDTGSNSLSPGAKAGIGVGVAVGVLALIGTAALLFFLRWRNQRREGSETDTMVNSRNGSPSFSMARPYTEYGNLQWGPAYDDNPPPDTYTHDSNSHAQNNEKDWQNAEARAYVSPLELEQPKKIHEMHQQEFSHEMIGEGHYREISAIRSER